MSANAQALLEQLKRLPPADQQEVFRQLLRLLNPPASPTGRPFPTVKVQGGPVTPQHVGEALDDE